MNITFENKRILVTGGCQGIGKGICLRLSEYKGTVIALSNNKDNLAKLSQEYPNIRTVCVNLLDWDATREAVKSVLPIDLLVNNAGIGSHGSWLKVTSTDFDDTFGVNVKAMFNVSQVVAQNMIERNVKSGAIVNLSSQTGVTAHKDFTVYCCSKAAVTMLTKSLARELGPHNIRVNCVQPTLVMTDSTKNFIKDIKKAEDMKNRIPLGRFAEVEDVVDAVVYLLSDRSSMITGTGLPVDGGYLTT
ncbi:L-xylulose reductase-like [Copidosoma floridanum]|uniref:L-xylulose reductase-like n=1 Tax=Copidosoma floridanum TaxID=29053 RepID=UPI000C6F9514|nr:L-xylulose reductase-like [Copidosoma floridanum]